MALSKNKPRHDVGNPKIYFFAKFRQNIPTFRTILAGKTANGGEPNALHVSYQRPSKSLSVGSFGIVKKHTHTLKSDFKSTVSQNSHP